ncbi:hypothetical protein [Vibrio phage D4]|nr:hypothetical protein [Vibrio phage D4]
MKITIENLENWTGEGITLTANVNARSFKMYDHTFTVGEFTRVTDKGGFVQLFGSGWGEDPVTTLHFFDTTEDPTLEAIITKAAKWIANHI